MTFLAKPEMTLQLYKVAKPQETKVAGRKSSLFSLFTQNWLKALVELWKQKTLPISTNVAI